MRVGQRLELGLLLGQARAVAPCAPCRSWPCWPRSRPWPARAAAGSCGRSPRPPSPRRRGGPASSTSSLRITSTTCLQNGLRHAGPPAGGSAHLRKSNQMSNRPRSARICGRPRVHEHEQHHRRPQEAAARPGGARRRRPRPAPAGRRRTPAPGARCRPAGRTRRERPPTRPRARRPRQRRRASGGPRTRPPSSQPGSRRAR